MTGASDNDSVKKGGPSDTEGDEIRTKLTGSDEQVQYSAAERLVEIGTEHPEWLANHVDLVEHALLSDQSRVRNRGMRAVLDVVNEDPSAGTQLIDPALEAVRKQGAPSAKGDLIKALWGIHQNTDASISTGDAVYADLISTANTLVVERVVEYIGGAVMDDPEAFPETITSMVEALDVPDKSVVTNTVIVLGVIARDAPESLPDPEALAEKLESVRDRQLLQDEKDTIDKALRFVRDAATSDATEGTEG